MGMVKSSGRMESAGSSPSTSEKRRTPGRCGPPEDLLRQGVDGDIETMPCGDDGGVQGKEEGEGGSAASAGSKKGRGGRCGR